MREREPSGSDGLSGPDGRGGSGVTSGSNELSGVVYGPSVQAGTVHGGVHVWSAQDPREHVPWQLPPTVHLTDRSDELRALERHRARAAREGHPVLATVSGLGGVGKTAVALSWLHTLRPRFPGGQLYADLGAQAAGGAGTADPAEVLGHFLRGLGVPGPRVPVDFAERSALFRSLTMDRRLVVLLDDAATAAQVRPLLPGGGNVVVVTSRWRLSGLTVDGSHPLHLEPMPTEAAVELLADTLADGRVAAQMDEARALVDLCAGLPLAVRVAGARLAARPLRRITTMVQALSEERDRLEGLAIEGDHNVLAALDLSYQGLPADAARLYRLLGLHPGPEFGAGVAAALLAEPGGSERRARTRTARLLDVLHDANLLVDAGDERYRFHDLVRLHAYAKAEEDETRQQRAAAQRRLADHYLATATRAEETVDPQHRTLARDYGEGPVLAADPGPEPEDALDWLERELPNLMALVRRARCLGLPTVCWQLVDAMWPLFVRRKHYEQWRTAHQEGLAAAEELGDTVAQCRMLTSGGLGELGSGAHERALEMFDRASRLFEDSGDPLGHVRTLNYRGLAHQRLGRPGRAAELFERAAAGLARLGDARAAGLARLNLADVALGAGEADRARDEAGRARAALAEEGDRYNAARAATLLGRSCLARGETDEAERWLSDGLAALREMRADYETARSHQALAELDEARGRPVHALDHYREAQSLYTTAGRPEAASAVGQRLRELGGDADSGAP